MTPSVIPRNATPTVIPSAARDLFLVEGEIPRRFAPRNDRKEAAPRNDRKEAALGMTVEGME
jgi:hypothetical protein